MKINTRWLSCSKIQLIGIVLAVCLLASPALTDEAKVFHDFTEIGFSTAYSGWMDRVKPGDWGVRIEAPVTGGVLVNRGFSLAGYEEGTPALKLRVLNGNTAKMLRLILRDMDGTATAWVFPIDEATAGEVVTIHARGATPLGEPNLDANAPGKAPGLDLSALTQLHVQGSFRGGTKVGVELLALIALPDDPAFAAEREKSQAEQARRQKEKKRREREAMLRRLAGSKSDFIDMAPATDRILVVHFDEGWIDHTPERLSGKANGSFKPNAEPQVRFISPKAGARFDVGRPITIEVEATDADGRVLRPSSTPADARRRRPIAAA